MSRSDRFFRRLAALQLGHPWLLLLAVVLTCVPALRGALRLELRTDWTELLPEDQRSIRDLQRIKDRVGSTGTLTVAIEGEDLAAMKRLADDLAVRLRALPAELVAWVDKDLTDERRFFESNRYLYVSTPDLEELRDKLRERVRDEKVKTVMDLGLDDEEDRAQDDDTLDLDALRKKYQERIAELDHYPDGYYVGEQGRLLALFVRAPFSSSSIARTDRLEAEVKQVVEGLSPPDYHRSIRVLYAGDLLTARAEHDAIRDELIVVSAIAIGLILASIFCFYFELRSILVLGTAILVGLIWTFGLTYLKIGYLSTATSFLSSIVAGNGINSGIILIARFLEERRKGGTVAAALETAMRTTWAATLTAAGAASLSYGALMLTDFRGFSQFGFIGGFGLMLCWLANYLVLPTLLGLTERERATAAAAKPHRGGFYGVPFAYLAERRPAVTAAVGLALALAGLGLGYRWLTGDPFEYDFRRLRNESSRQSGVGALTGRINAITRHRPNQGMVVLADRPDQVPQLVQAFERVRSERQDAAGQAPIGGVRSVLDLVPAEQERKRALLAEIRDLADTILPRLSAEKRAEVEPWVPPAEVQAVALAGVPGSLRRLYTEKDGREGLVVYVEEPRGMSMWDGRVLLGFADAVRAIELPNGEVVHSSGRAVIFADMLNAIRKDGPWLTWASFAAIALLVLLTFRSWTYSALVLGTLAVGMGWMIGLTALSGLKLNFLNFIAIPITIGIGVDYAVNIVRRYALDGWGSIRSVLLETGGAVILCSLTTIFGYLSLLYSDNQALRSFGKLAVLGEFTCLGAAILVLPGLAALAARRRARAAALRQPPVTPADHR